MRKNRFVDGKLMLSVILTASFFVGVNTYAQSFQEYNNVRVSEGGYTDSPGGHGRREGPPTEAVESCNSLGESEACSFTSPRGDEISGTCKYLPGNKFACVPEGGPPGGRRPPEDRTPAE